MTDSELRKGLDQIEHIRTLLIEHITDLAIKTSLNHHQEISLELFGQLYKIESAKTPNGSTTCG